VYLALDAFHGLGVQAHLIEERLEETNGLPIGTFVALLRDCLDAQELLELLHALLLLSRPLLHCLSFHLSQIFFYCRRTSLSSSLVGPGLSATKSAKKEEENLAFLELFALCFGAKITNSRIQAIQGLTISRIFTHCCLCLAFT
jgi:hypothetical protein